MSTENVSHLIHVVVLAAVLLSPLVARPQSIELIHIYQRFDEARAQSDLTAAIEHGRAALALAEDAFGSDNADTVDSIERLGEVLVLAGEYGDGEIAYRRALEIKERQLGSDHPDLISILDALVTISLRQDEFADAETLLKRILRIERSVYGDQHENVRATLTQLRDLYESILRSEDVAQMEREIDLTYTVTRDLEMPPPDDVAIGDERRYEPLDGAATVRVFYGTNRARTGKVKATQFYGAERGELEMGYLDVSIPEVHKYGELETESGWSIFSYVLGEEAKRKRYVLLQKVESLDKQSFFTQLQNHIAGLSSNDVFVFVHGYNSSFEDAAKRTAQLAYDLDFDGTPMLYSWPSKASTHAYTVDEAAVRIGGRRMATFLEDVVANAGAGRIHLIAHSMGNRALIEALGAYVAKLGREAAGQVFGQIVFTAPDVDRDYFVEIIEDIRGIAERVTLYASENDKALLTSNVLHGAPRAGQAGDSIVTIPGLDTIDMSAVEADILGHAYFAANEGALYDLFRLLWLGESPPDRCGMSETALGDAGFWLFNVDHCSGADLLEAGLLLKRFGPEARARVVARLEALADSSDDTAKEEWSRILNRLESLLTSDDQP
jgi:esterase/lipase superfamily enzyme